MRLYSEFHLDAGFLHDHTVNKSPTLKRCLDVVLHNFVLMKKSVFNKNTMSRLR